MSRNILAILTFSMSVGGCFNIPLASTGKLDKSANGNTGGITQAVSTSVSADKEIASIDPNAKTDVYLTPPKVQGLTGASVAVPPGSLGVAVDLVVEQASDFGETSIAGEMGLSNDIQVAAASPGMIIRPTENVDLKKPLSLAMPLPVSFGFHLQNGSKYGIFYKYFDPTEQKLVTGLKLVDGVTVKLTFDESSGKDVLTFSGYFGAYWAAILSREVAPTEVPSPKPAEEPIINKAKVAVIQNTGIVKETEVVQKQAIAELIWNRPSIKFDAQTRTVFVSATPPVNQKVEACKIDLFDSTTAKSGVSLESPLGTQVEYVTPNVKEHAIVARFRCTDAQARITITPWSDVILIPALNAPSPVVGSTPTNDFCSDAAQGVSIQAKNEMGQYTFAMNVPKISKCKYAAKVFIQDNVELFITSPDYTVSCGLASHTIGLGAQTLSCSKMIGGSLGSNYMSLVGMNYQMELDFTSSLTSPRLTLSLLPCTLGDFYIQSAATLSASVQPTAADKMIHKGACEFEKIYTSNPPIGAFITFRNLAGDYSCGNPNDPLDAGRYIENACSAGALRYFPIGMNVTAPAHKFRLKLGESATEDGMWPNRQSVIRYEVETQCPDRLYFASTALGLSPVEGQNVLYRYGACSYSGGFFVENPNLVDYNFKLKSFDGTRVCGGTISAGVMALDCSVSAPAFNFPGAYDKAYNFLIEGDANSGALISGNMNEQTPYCSPQYLHADVAQGYSNSISSAMSEVKQCYFEKLWTPVAGSMGFNLVSAQHEILGAGYDNGSQPSLGGAATRVNWFDSPQNAQKFLPLGVSAGVTYKVTLDMRYHSTTKVKVETYSAGSNVCPDDLHLIADAFVESTPTSDNRLTYHGACNYSITLRNESTNTKYAYYRVANSTNTVQCGYSGTPAPNLWSPDRNYLFSCGSSIDPLQLELQPFSAVRLHIKRTSGGNAFRMVVQNLSQSMSDLMLAGPAAAGLSVSQASLVNPVTTYAVSNEKSFLWNPSSPLSFNFKSTSSNYYCYPETAGSNAISTNMNVRCRHMPSPSMQYFGNYAAGRYRIRFIQGRDLESPNTVKVEPYFDVPGVVLVAPKTQSTGINYSPNASPNETATTTPGGLFSATTWSSNDGSLYLFGGSATNASVYYNALWKYSPSTGFWTLVNGSTTPNLQTVTSGTPSPGARSDAQGWMDQANGRLYLFGGHGYGDQTEPGILCDLWYYEISSNTWNFVKGSYAPNHYVTYPSPGQKGVSDPSFIVPARKHAITFTDAGGNFWLFGGYAAGGQAYADMWKFTPTSGTGSQAGNWTWVLGPDGANSQPGTMSYPDARFNAAVWQVGNFAYMFGGHLPGIGDMTDLWRFDATNNIWTQLKAHKNDSAIFWENFGFHEQNRPLPINASQQLTWVQSNDKLWLYNLGAFYVYRPSLNAWAISSKVNVMTDINGDILDPFVNTTSFDVQNDMGRRISAMSWTSPSGFYLYGGITNSYSQVWNDLWKIQLP